MNVVIDASVFISAARRAEAQYAESRAFLGAIRQSPPGVFCPVIVLAECGGAVARFIRKPRLAEVLVSSIRAFPSMQLVELTEALGQRAAAVAIALRLRGADAVYVSVAEKYEATLVTWDQEILERAAGTIVVKNPAQWLQDHGPALGAAPPGR